MSDPFDEPDNDPTVIEPEAPEPEVQAEVQPEVEAGTETEAAPEAEAEEPSVPQVPIHTLHEARQQNRELRNQMQALREQQEQFATLKEELNQQRLAAQAAEQEQQFNQDPLGAIQNDLKSLKAQQEQAKIEQQTAEAQNQQRQALETTIASSVAEFSQTHTDYAQAVEHMLDTRAKELQFMGAAPGQIQQMLQQEAEQLAQSAVMNGENPAELVYNLAKLRGYNGPAPTKAAPSVDNLVKGQAAAQSLTGTQGDADEVSLVSIEAMTDAEFDAFWEKEMKPGRH